MSPATYPPLHAGDDVDATFFDELGDEASVTSQEGSLEEHLDLGRLKLADGAGHLELLTTPASAGICPSSIVSEAVDDQGHQPVCDLEIELYSSLSQSSPSEVHDPGSSGQGNGETSGAEACAVDGVDSIPDRTKESQPDVNQAAFSVAYDGRFLSASDELGSGVFHQQIGHLDLSSDSTPASDPRATGSAQFLKANQSPRRQFQTTVTEVQWSDFNSMESSPFGNQGGFGSFADLFTEFPRDMSTEPSANFTAQGSEAHFNPVSVTTGSVIGSGFQVEPSEELSFFDRQGGVQDGHVQTSELVSGMLLGGFESPQPVQLSSNGEEQLSQWQPLVQEKQVDGRMGRWENLYPGWVYNYATGEWRQTDGTGSIALNSELNVGVKASLTDQAANGDAYTLQSLLQSEWASNQQQVVKADIDLGQPQEQMPHVESVWQQSVEGTEQQLQAGWENQYPGWYYDHQSQEWRECTPASWDMVAVPNKSAVGPDESASLATVGYQQGYGNPSTSSDYDGKSMVYPDGPAIAYSSDGWVSGQNQVNMGSSQSLEQETVSHLADSVAVSRQYDASRSSEQHTGSYNWDGGSGNHWTAEHQVQYMAQPSFYQPDNTYTPITNSTASQNWGPSFSPSNGTPLLAQHQVPNRYYDHFGTSQITNNSSQTWMPHQYGQNMPQNSIPKSLAEALRSSVGRPPHILTSCGFGGKLLIMKLKDPLNLQASDGEQSVASGQALVPGPIHIHNLSQVVVQNSDNGGWEHGSLYFGALSRQVCSGPLAGGSFSSKDLSKWLDERAVNCQAEEPNSNHPGALSMLWGLLKVACLHYGKLRSNAGALGIMSQEENRPEVALGKLLTSGVEHHTSWTTCCLQSLPSEQQLQMTASEVRKLLVAGKPKEALKHAQHGQLWGPALVLARQLGEKFYSDTVAEMAQRQFVSGSPLRTLSLLLAGQPAEVFTVKNLPSSPRAKLNQVPLLDSSQDGLGSMLEEWHENLAIMAANRTTGDDRVILHLGDCLWRVKGEVEAAHICYLVADGNFESFSSNARLCLIGADHWKYPRTFVTPEAIQRTEIYEYAKLLGNPQYILLPFQPFKLIYASMLAEAGRTTEALRYCQAILKILKTASRSPELETCRLATSALEERLRFHGQDGQGLAPVKLIGRFLGALDRGIHGIIGGPPPSIPQEHFNSKLDSGEINFGLSRPGSSPNRTASPLVPSASSEGLVKEGTRPNMPQRSVSEPDFSKAPMKDNSEVRNQDKGKPSNGSAGGYFGRFGSSIIQKAVGFVAKSNKKEAKLGEKNKFYYDEKLKRWVEEGAELPQDEVLPPPPPTSSKFVSSSEELLSDSGFGGGSKISSFGTPPVPPSNQFSARRNQGVRSRYVDTFNKGGVATSTAAPTSLPLIPSARAGGVSSQPMKFFIPAPSINNTDGPGVSFENGASAAPTDESHTSFSANFDEHVEAQKNLAMKDSYDGRLLTTPPTLRTSDKFSGSFKLVEGDSSAGVSLNNGESNGNGFHSRAASWSGYPSNFQGLQFSTEGHQAKDGSTAAYITRNGYSSERPMNNRPPIGSYFQPPRKIDFLQSLSNEGTVESSLPPASVGLAPLLAATDVLIPRVREERSRSQGTISSVGDDLQEVEL